MAGSYTSVEERKEKVPHPCPICGRPLDRMITLQKITLEQGMKIDNSHCITGQSEGSGLFVFFHKEQIEFDEENAFTIEVQ